MKVSADRLKLLAGIIAGIITIGTAVSAHFKEETTAKATYAELSGAVKELSDSTVQNYKDIAAINGYLKALREKTETDKDIEIKALKQRLAELEKKTGLPRLEPQALPPAPRGLEIPRMGMAPRPYQNKPIEKILE